MSVLQRVHPGDIVKYAFLPRIVPRVRDLLSSGFGWIAYMMAYIYAGVRLLPSNHPYLQSKNFGRFGIRHVIAEAANRLEFRRDRIDQIVVFFALLTGFALLILQFVMLAAAILVHPALAQTSTDFQGFFKTVNPNDDIALELLDKVFAIPGMFGSKYDPAGGGISGIGGNGIPGFNQGLQKLIKFYNMAMLIVGVVIFLYYIVVVVAETANTGTPFGRRFSHIYAPLRLVIAIGLLVPLGYGFNSAQYITLFAAKFGSGLATNTWLLFNKTIADNGQNGGSNNPLASPGQTLVARPQMPDVGDIVAFMALVKTCANGYKIEYQKPPYAESANSGAQNASSNAFSSGAASGEDSTSTENVDVEPYLVWGNTQEAALTSTDYPTAVGSTMFNGHDIIVRFGHFSQKMFPSARGYVYPYCGEITVPIGDVTQVGSQEMQARYYQLIKDLWKNTELDQFAQRAAAIYLVKGPNKGHPEAVSITPFTPPNDTVDATGASSGGGASAAAATSAGGSDTGGDLPAEAIRNQILRSYNEPIAAQVIKARDDMVSQTDFSITDDLKARGWGGAAIWYNRIAMWNGGFFGAVFQVPRATAMPSIMVKVEEERKTNNQNIDSDNRYEPYIVNDQLPGIQAGEEGLAKMMSAVYKYWQVDTPGARNDARPTGNVMMDLINKVFPYNALMQIRYNIDIHPLAQLVGLGKSIIDSSLSNLTVGLAFAAGGGFMRGMQSAIGAPLTFLSSAFLTLTTITLAIGFTLYYVLPFMPFIYFFFAVGGWVKSIFEAMVGVPLWALAHLRIDGDGLPGERAMEGYFLIFEIFLRPVLILFGLLGSLLIFSAMARTLHDVFSLLVYNVGGVDQTVMSDSGGIGSDTVASAKATKAAVTANRGSPLDEFFYTVIYTIILYSLALSSFKLIDLIPNSVLRWSGSGVQSFANDNSAPAQQLLGYVTVANQIADQQIIGGLNRGVTAAGEGLGSLFARNNDVKPIGIKKGPPKPPPSTPVKQR